MYGLELENPFPPTVHQRRVLEFFRSQSQVVSSWEERFEETNWHDFFRLKTVDYTGEEVLCAQYTTWGNLAPAMPKEIALVPLADVCELGCRHYEVQHTATLEDLANISDPMQGTPVSSDPDTPSYRPFEAQEQEVITTEIDLATEHAEGEQGGTAAPT